MHWEIPLYTIIRFVEMEASKYKGQELFYVFTSYKWVISYWISHTTLSTQPDSHREKVIKVAIPIHKWVTNPLNIQSTSSVAARVAYQEWSKVKNWSVDWCYRISKIYIWQLKKYKKRHQMLAYKRIKAPNWW